MRAKAVLLALLPLRGGALSVTLPDGACLRFGDEGALKARLDIHQYRALQRVAAKGDIGFGEAYLAGEWSAPDLAATLTLLAGNAEAILRYFTSGWRGRAQSAAPRCAQFRAGSRRNILAHYDLGDSFFEAAIGP